MAQTLCPDCGHSPIPDGADACPKCGARFDFVPAFKRAQTKFIDRRFDSESIEPTMIGGAVAGALSFHPGPAAAGLYALAAAWFARAALLPGDSTEAASGFALALCGLATGTGLIVGGSWARRAAQGAAALSVAVALLQGSGGTLDALYALLGATCLTSVLGEPSLTRRYVTVGCALSVAALCGLALVMPRAAAAVPSVGAEATELPGPGASVRLPAGMAVAAALPGPLGLPPTSLTSASGALVGAGGRAAVITVFRAEPGPLADACQSHGKLLGGQGPGVRLQRAAPASLGSGGLVLELSLGGDQVALLACARRPDGRTAALAALGAGGRVEDAARVLDAVGAGLAVK